MRKCAYTRSDPHLAAMAIDPRHRCSMAVVDDMPALVYDEKANVVYEVGHLLGKGGFARCFLASADGQEFALKSITRESIRKETHWRKIRKEIASHFTLRHPNIVALYSHFEDRDNIYMLLEHCPNGTLADYVDASPGHYIIESNAVVLVKQLLKAVRYLHCEKRILHRDIKPGNILLSREMTVKLADFGFCCSIEELAGRQVHTVCGTPNYVDKQVIDKCGHSTASESWAIGCTLFCMLYGKPPFHSECLETTYARIRLCNYRFPSTHHEFVSPRARDLIRRVLVPERSQRLSIDEMMAHPLLSPTINRTHSHGSGLNAGGASHHSSNPTTPRNSTTAFSPRILRPAVVTPTIVRPTNQNALLCDSGLGGSDHCSSGSHRLHKHIADALERHLSALSTMLERVNHSSRLVVEEGVELTPQFIAKWVDYTNKFGFGATLRDGTRTLLFNDQSSISYRPSSGELSYWRRLLTDGELFGSVWQDSAEVEEKYQTLRSLQAYMDSELYSFIRVDEVVMDVHSRGSARRSKSVAPPSSRNPTGGGGRELDTNNNYLDEDYIRRAERLDPPLHVMDFHKLTNAFMMLLSDGTCQINFAQSRYKMTLLPMGAGHEYQIFLATPHRKIYGIREVSNGDGGDGGTGMTSEAFIQQHLEPFKECIAEYHELATKRASQVGASTDC